MVAGDGTGGLITGMAPRARLMLVKALGGFCFIARAHQYVIESGADIMNMSFSVPGHSVELQRAIQYARSRGVVCVAAAGNQGESTLVYPAGFAAGVGVAATTLGDELSEFSNHGNALVDLAAPGAGVVSTYPGGVFGAGWGTSFSAPLVAGTAALIRHHHAGGDIAAFEGLVHDLRSGSVAIQDLAGDVGSGRLDIQATVLAASQ